MLAWIDKRLRQASGKLDLPLGGFSIILIGDFGQLPPVGDKPLYASPSSHPLSVHGHHIYKLFNTVIILEYVLCQNGTDPMIQRFREFLLQLRNSNVSRDDWEMLLQRAPHKVQDIHLFNDAIHLFYDKASVAKYNLEKLQGLRQPIAQINAIHSQGQTLTKAVIDLGQERTICWMYICGFVSITYTRMWCNSANAL